MRMAFITNGTEQDLQFAQEHSIPCVEINVHQNLTEWESRKESYKNLLIRYGIQVDAMGIWGRNYISDDAHERQVCLNELKRHIDLASFLEAEVLMTGGGEDPDQPVEFQAQKACEILRPMIDYAAGKGIKFAFYNCHWTNHITGPTAWDVVSHLLPEVGIKFDPSHPFYDDVDYLEHARDYGHMFIHFHAKGSMKVEGRHFEDPPAGMDQIDWRSLFAILHKHNYRGDISIEPHSETWSGDRYYKGILFSKRFLEQFMI